MTDRIANHLGALATALTDRFGQAMSGEVGVGGVAASVLVLIDAEPGLTIEALAGIAGVRQPSMTRAVAVLAEAGLVAKTPGRDRRTLVLALTEAGRARLARMLELRAAVLGAALAAVAPADRPALARALAAMLEALPQAPGERFRICRLCDEDACGPPEDCPVERGAAARR